eukprot:6208234-Pleurochrysis_carterae.AAC.2
MCTRAAVLNATQGHPAKWSGSCCHCALSTNKTIAVRRLGLRYAAPSAVASAELICGHNTGGYWYCNPYASATQLILGYFSKCHDEGVCVYYCTVTTSTMLNRICIFSTPRPTRLQTLQENATRVFRKSTTMQDHNHAA